MTPLSQLSERYPTTRRKADQMDRPVKCTRLITKQPPETLSGDTDAVDHAESQPFEDRSVANEMLSRWRSSGMAKFAAVLTG